MNTFLSTVHPTEGFDILVVYDKDSLRIEYIWDDNKEEVNLNFKDLKLIKKEIERNVHNWF